MAGMAPMGMGPGVMGPGMMPHGLSSPVVNGRPDFVPHMAQPAIAMGPHAQQVRCLIWLSGMPDGRAVPELSWRRRCCSSKRHRHCRTGTCWSGALAVCLFSVGCSLMACCGGVLVAESRKGRFAALPQ